MAACRETPLPAPVARVRRDARELAPRPAAFSRRPDGASPFAVFSVLLGDFRPSASPPSLGRATACGLDCLRFVHQRRCRPGRHLDAGEISAADPAEPDKGALVRNDIIELNILQGKT